MNDDTFNTWVKVLFIIVVLLFVLLWAVQNFSVTEATNVTGGMIL